MKEHFVIHHSYSTYWFKSSNFEDAYYSSKLTYSLRHLTFCKEISPEMIAEAMKKSLQVCFLAGVNSKHHFKKIFVFDSNTGSLYTDWLMSKKGFNLLMTQIPLQNENLARWLWQLAYL